MGYTVSFLSHKIDFLCKLLNIFERIWNILLWTQSVDAISLGMPSIALSLAWSDWCLSNVSKIHRPASLAAFHPCYNKILSADKFLRKTWNRFPFILFCCVKDLGYLSCCNNHKQIEHKKIFLSQLWERKWLLLMSVSCSLQRFAEFWGNLSTWAFFPYIFLCSICLWLLQQER